MSLSTRQKQTPRHTQSQAIRRIRTHGAQTGPPIHPHPYPPRPNFETGPGKTLSTEYAPRSKRDPTAKRLNNRCCFRDCTPFLPLLPISVLLLLLLLLLLILVANFIAFIIDSAFIPGAGLFAVFSRFRIITKATFKFPHSPFFFPSAISISTSGPPEGVMSAHRDC